MSHNISRAHPSLAFTTTALLSFVLAFICSAQVFVRSADAKLESTSQVQNTDPMAVIKTIVIGGAEKTEASIAEVTITRATGTVEPARADTRLFFGDEVATASGAQVTLLFLDDAPEKDNEVLVDANSRVRIGSIFTWLGRVVIRVRGAFETKTEKVRLGVQGTEFEVVVLPDGTNRVTVLEGLVSIEKLTTTLLRQPFDELSTPRFLPASLTTDPFTQQKLELTAIAGESTTIVNNFTFANRCGQGHQYQIQGPANLQWFHILGADRFEVAGAQSKTITFALQMDAQRVRPGTYEGDIVARCLDCQSSSCDLAGALLHVSIRVITRGGGPVGAGTPSVPTSSPTPSIETATPTPAPVQTKVSAGRLQEVVIDNNGMTAPTTAAEGRLTETINWSTKVILAGSPTYSAESVAPHFESWNVRDERFREARARAILNNDPQAYKTLGDVYADWGNGAKAADSYSRVRSTDASKSAAYYTDIAEALRLAGRLEDAIDNLKKALALDPSWAPALNTIGNVQLDAARITRDQKNYAEARASLEKARLSYEAAAKAASQAAPTTSTTSNQQQSVKTVAQANLGAVYLEYGELAREQGKQEEALQNYLVAERSLRNASDLDPSYAFAKSRLGDVYRASGLVLGAQGERNRAEQFFTRAQDEYGRALNLHRDMAEAVVGVGSLLEATGRRDEAIRTYQRAAQIRPDLSEPHYRLAVALAPVNPRLAAEYAATFLKLTPRVFKNGERARTAESIRREIPVNTSSPTPYVTPTQSPTPVPTATTSTGDFKPVKVPGTKGDKPESADAKIKKVGLQTQFRNVADCEASGKVLYTEPQKDARVPSGSMVTIFVSSAGEDPATVPQLTKMSVQSAEQQLREASLTMRVGRREETDRAEPDTVLRQKPDPYRKLKKGCEVELTIAIPIPPVRVRSFIGMTVDNASQAISFDKLSQGRVTEVESRYPEGTVVDQSPRAGEVVPRGTRVDLVISQITSTIVPSVIGRTESEARAILGRRGLNAERVPGGEGEKVTRQEPSPGTRVQRGTTVRLWFIYVSPGRISGIDH